MSLVPSVTETLVRWAAPPVACTRFCEQPDIRQVGGTKNPEVPAIVDLAPDLVVMCVEENRQEDAQALAGAGIATAALSIEGVADVPPAMEMLAGLLDLAPEVSREVGEAVEAALADVQAAGEEECRGELRAFVPIWKRPWMTISGDTYGSSLLAALGVTNVFADAPERYPEVTLEAVAARRPDVVLAPSEPYPFAERHVPLLREVAPVTLVDGQDLFWWGARTPEAILRLGSQLSNLLRR